MRTSRLVWLVAAGTTAVFGTANRLTAQTNGTLVTIAPTTMSRAGTVNERFQSYNIEMVEVTGGRFWKPYGSNPQTKTPSGNQPAGVDPSAFEFRPPINLTNARLRKLASALGPAYVRVSGTWANTTYFQNSDGPVMSAPPEGFKGILTRAQWKGVVEFAHAVNAEIVASFSIGPGTRNAAGEWTTDQAQQLFDYTHSIGGRIAGAEYFNEPNLAFIGGAPKGFDAAAYGRDVKAFRAFVKKMEPAMLLLGPGSVGESSLLNNSSPVKQISSNDLLTATGPIFDAISYHSYGAVSSRCSRGQPNAGIKEEQALSKEWLTRPGKIEEFYSDLRDHFEPGKPLWNTETAQAACGGDIWASTFLDTFRYLNQLGLLAKRGVQVQMHNTLAASDYGLIDEKTYDPRPNYWAARLWHQLMGTTVLDAGPSSASDLYLYAHCLRDSPDGVALLLVNASEKEARSLKIAAPSERFTLTAKQLANRKVQLNGNDLKLRGDDSPAEFKGVSTPSGEVILPPTSITFLAVPEAHNASCHP